MNDFIKKENESCRERYELALGRITEIHRDSWESMFMPGNDGRKHYLSIVSYMLLQAADLYEQVESGTFREKSLRELQYHNVSLYSDIIRRKYDNSLANPDVAVKELGEEFGPYLCALYAELRGCIVYAVEQRLSHITRLFELFLEVYGIMESDDCSVGEIKSAMYYYFFDYADMMVEDRMAQQFDSSMDFAGDIVMNADLDDLRYLYYYGEYVSKNEIGTARYLNSLSQEQIDLMASTFTEGFRRGYENYRMDMGSKKTVMIEYNIGFERVVRAAVKQFADMGLTTNFQRAGVSMSNRTGISKRGFYGASPNKQYDYDHRLDMALIFDKAYADRLLSVRRTAFEKYKADAQCYAGPAVMEIFGEHPFTPKDKETCPQFKGKQKKQYLEYKAANGVLTNEYIRGDNVSFTIIAYPVPEIGVSYKKIFDETIRVNTLDGDMYTEIQSKIIDALDEGEYVKVTGRGDNHTDMTIMLTPQEHPESETRFENCVADVNIPVGEVFTSPQLKGTNGVLHVTDVFLNGLGYENFEMRFEDGVIKDYSCSNFEDAEKGKKYIFENVMFQHDTLPIGEFAIGTNTTAYVMGKKFDISELLPILIAEKTGPHFAVGDTCFSNEEDMETFNPDGKKMIAKENDYSRLRHTDRTKAYFNCHTDITIPYDELGDITVHKKDGSEIKIISQGRFVLEGTKKLNEPLDNFA